MKQRYVEKLAEMHIAAKQFVEAGLALKLHADLLAWSDDVVEEFKNTESRVLYEQRTQRERKAAILERVVDFLDRGEVWEKAMPICKELAHQFEHELQKVESKLDKKVKLLETKNEGLKQELDRA